MLLVIYRAGVQNLDGIDIIPLATQRLVDGLDTRHNGVSLFFSLPFHVLFGYVVRAPGRFIVYDNDWPNPAVL